MGLLGQIFIDINPQNIHAELGLISNLLKIVNLPLQSGDCWKEHPLDDYQTLLNDWAMPISVKAFT